MVSNAGKNIRFSGVEQNYVHLCSTITFSRFKQANHTTLVSIILRSLLKLHSLNRFMVP